MKLKAKNLLYSNLMLIFLSPIILNFTVNILQKKITPFNYLYGNVQSLLFNIIFFIFFLFLGKKIKDALALETTLLALIYFFSSFFLFDFLTMPFLGNLQFKHSVLVVLIAWSLFLLYVSKSKISIILLAFYYIVIQYLNSHFYTELNDLEGYLEINTDVPVQWFKLAELIHSNNLLFAYQNNIIDGQGLFASYIQALIFKINFFNFDFTFIRLNANLLLFLGIVLIYDLRLSNKNKFILTLTFISLILNNDWLTYLFIDSLMLEGIVSLIFACYVFNLQPFLKSTQFNLKSQTFFIFFGCLIFSKQFVSLLAVFITIYLLVKYKNKNCGTIFILFVLDYLYKNIYTPTEQRFEYLKDADLINLTLDILFLRNIEFSNIFKILEQHLLDKPVTYLIILFFLLNIVNKIDHRKQSSKLENNISFSVFLVNTLLIFMLFSVWWKDFGIQSSYRYTLNLLHLIFISIGLNLNHLENKFKFIKTSYNPKS